MISPRIKPSAFFPEEAPDDLFLVRQRKAKLEGYVQSLAAMDELIDFGAMTAAVDRACPRPDRSKGGRPPYATEVLVRMVFLQGLYNLSDEQCEHQVLDRLSFQRFCRLDGALHIPDARTLWSFRQRLAHGGLGAQAIFETLSQQLQRHGYIPRGGQIVDASIVQAPITQATTQERRGPCRLEQEAAGAHRSGCALDAEARQVVLRLQAARQRGRTLQADPTHRDHGSQCRRWPPAAEGAADGQHTGPLVGRSRLRQRSLSPGAATARLCDGIARRARPGQTAKVRLKQRNKTISRRRARVEHVFAALHQQGGKCVRAMSLARNALSITLACVAYNARRLAWLVKSGSPPARAV
jgi:IS5 family transposase